MNLGMETECVEHKRSTSEMREGMESVASILNKHGHGTLYFGVRPPTARSWARTSPRRPCATCPRRSPTT